MIFDALFEPRQLSTSNARNPAQWLIDWFDGGSDTAAGIPVSERSALTYSAVWAATRILSEGVASVPCVLYRRRQQREGKDKATDHLLYRVLHDEPNSEMDSLTFFDQQMPFLVNSGNAYSEKERMLSGRIAGLWPLKSPDVNPVRRDDGQIEYEVKRDQGGQDIVAAKDMLHVTGVLSKDGIIGKGVVQQARESIAMGQATEKYGARFFGEGGWPGGVLTTEQTLGDKAYARMKSWSDKHGGVGKSHKLAVLEEGTKYQAIGISPEHAQFLQTRQHNITELARWYRLPPHMLADLSKATYSNIEEQSLSFVIYSLRPWWVRWERAIQRQLLTKEEKPQLFVGFNADALLRGDSKSRTESYKNKFAMGAITVNRVLGLEDENEIGPDGDRRFIPMNMIPLDRADDYIDALMKKAAATNNPRQRGPGDGGDQDGAGDVEQNSADWRASMLQPFCEVVQASEQRLSGKMDAQNTQSGEQYADLMADIAGVTQVVQTFPEYMYEVIKVHDDQSARRDKKTRETVEADGQKTREAVASGMTELLAGIEDAAQSISAEFRPVAASAAQHDEAYLRRTLAEAEVGIDEVYLRMIGVEITEATRAAKAPKTFLPRLDRFYKKHSGSLSRAVHQPIATWLSVANSHHRAIDVAWLVADAHVAESRKQLLKACECKPEELVGRVAECVADWGKRRPCLPDIEGLKTTEHEDA